MLTVTATDFRKNMFGYLDKVASGQTVIIKRNHKAIAKLLPVQPKDWQDLMEEKIMICVSEEELIAPMEDIWDGYI